MQHGAVESVEDSDHSTVAGNENLLSVVAEFDSSPFTRSAEPSPKGSEGDLKAQRSTRTDDAGHDTTSIAPGSQQEHEDLRRNPTD